ncbi:Crp/Fnr family transcriptional regulator [Sinorhizobium numidicum]|uniref:Crp/Fnr family transcriptional regulator n=1 Tax=Sinorhizobium numidicum TaxID=680248 RepID=A0ABY8CW53_9HYPH|nr:Crp/Fnr family transcriptional regulator [Sinorhizobium numidicum]WEX78991.1 Crp/Fnr family transcriptional regulator [Sinorhizobium numidicum]WEX82387.1 Crp/Fnr family transcriptional regulator [Sinorhizobium numidicum]
MIAIMSEQIIAYLLPRAVTHRSFEKNEHLFHRGDPVRTMFVVTDGCANLIRYQEDGSPAVLQRSTPGTVLAEASLFSEHYHCDAVAATATEVMAVPVSEIRRLLNQDHVFALEWARHLSRELQSARKRAEIISLRTVGARLDAWLTWNDGDLPPKGEWRRLAEEIGVSPEALYREISKRRGLVRLRDP